MAAQQDANSDTEQSTFTWTEESVDFFLNAYHARIHLFDDPREKSGNLLADILCEMHENGFPVPNPNALSCKMRNMKHRYLSLLAAGKSCKWRYLKKMNEIFSDDSLPPPSLVEIETDQANVCLLRSYQKRKYRFDDPDLRRTDLWHEILVEMIENGFKCYNEYSLEAKFLRLRKQYETAKGKKSPECWPYYSIMDEIFSNKNSNGSAFNANESSSSVAAPGNTSSKQSEVNSTNLVVAPQENYNNEWEVEEVNFMISPPKRKASFSWNEEAVYFLMDAYDKRKHHFWREGAPKKKLWRTVLEEMKSAGFNVGSIGELDAKMRNMHFRYKTLKSEMIAGPNKSIKWKYFERMDAIFSSYDLRPNDSLALEEPYEEIKFEDDNSSDVEPSRSGMTWPPNKVVFFLECYRKRKHLFKDRKTRKKTVWHTILRDMQSAGYEVSDENALDLKLRTMKHTYKESKHKMSIGVQITWQYYDLMDSIFTLDGTNDLTEEMELDGESQHPIKKESSTESTEVSEAKSQSRTSRESRFEGDAVNIFLEAYHKRVHLFRDAKTKKKDVWRSILHEMQLAGFDVANEEMLDLKMRNMKLRYKTLLHKMRERKGHIRWQYFTKMHEIFSESIDNNSKRRDKRAFAAVASTSTTRQNRISLDERSQTLADIDETSQIELSNDQLTIQQLEIQTSESNQMPYEFEEIEISNGDNSLDPFVVNTEKEVILEIEQIENDNDESKCGEIRLCKNGDFLLVCGFCQEKHTSLSDFGLHLKEQHGDSSNKAENIVDSNANTETVSKGQESQRNDPLGSFKTKPREQDISTNESHAPLSANAALEDSAIVDEQSSSRQCSTPNQPTEDMETMDIQCKYCYEEFETHSQYLVHALTHKVDRPYSCGYCKQTFPTSKTRDSHERVHTGHRIFKCTNCPRIFLLKRQLRSHTSVHKEKERFPCRKCDKKLSSIDALRQHEKRKHSGILEKMGNSGAHVCDICGQRFDQRCFLKYHLKRHAGHVDYKCKECGKGFFSKGGLKNHLLVHTNEMPFECDVCLIKFNRATSLRNHINKMHAEESYHCCVCGKAYTSINALQFHENSHRGK